MCVLEYLKNYLKFHRKIAWLTEVIDLIWLFCHDVHHYSIHKTSNIWIKTEFHEYDESSKCEINSDFQSSLQCCPRF